MLHLSVMMKRATPSAYRGFFLLRWDTNVIFNLHPFSPWDFFMHFLLLTLNMTDYPLFPNWRKERKIFPIHGTPTILGDRSFSFWLRMRIRVEHFFEVSPDPLFLIGPKTHQKTSTQVTSEIFFYLSTCILLFEHFYWKLISLIL